MNFDEKLINLSENRIDAMDELDLRIIELLLEDGRRPYTEMAKRLGLSESTVRKRVQALVKEGVIRRFTVEVEPSKMGLRTVAIVGVDVEPPRLLEVAQRLSELREARWVATSTGDHMIVMEVWTRDGRVLTRLISESIGRIEGIERVCPAIILEKLKG